MEKGCFFVNLIKMHWPLFVFASSIERKKRSIYFGALEE